MSAGPIPDRVRASVFVAPGAPLEPRTFPRPDLAEGEALVEVACCTLCGSDLHTYLGRRHGPTPSVLGHEAVGRIAALGPGAPPRDLQGAALSIGDRVSWSVAASCGECFFCRDGLPQKCTRLRKYGHESCDGPHPLSGGLAEYCHLVRGTAIVRVPPELPDAVASSANCATATVAAAWRLAGGCREKTVVIQGAGLLGLTAAAMAQVGGAARVIVADVDPQRLAIAARFGAAACANIAADADRLPTEVMQSTDGRGADVILEMSGAAQAVQQGLALLRTGGKYILVGAVRPVGTVPLDLEHVVRRMWTIQGVHNYAPADLATAIDFLAQHHRSFPFGDLVARVFPLEAADEAFRAMASTGAIRVAVAGHMPRR